MLRVDVHIGNSEEPFETFFVKDKKEIEPRMDGYRTMFGKELAVNFKVTEEEGDAEAHDSWGY